MAFYIKSFKVTPQALEMKNAIPNGTPFSIETGIVCRKNTFQDKYYFKYSVNGKVIAESSNTCNQADEDNIIKNTVKINSDKWGFGSKSNVEVKVSVVQDSSGAELDHSALTWVES